MEARRRQASASTSTSVSLEETASNKNNHSTSAGTKSGSLTPKPDEDDDGTPRRTRNRNPLPPSKGPLFPPLPPKQPRNSPKNSPQSTLRSPVGRAPSLSTPIQSGSALANALDVKEGGGEEEPEASGSGSLPEEEVDVSTPLVPSASGTSLSPPPADGEVDDDEGKVEGHGGDLGADDTDDWGAYRRHRGVRGFNAAKSIKIEPSDDTNSPSRRASATADTPIESANSDREVDRGGSTSRQTRKRRGEDQLLLDDHLLPKEIRKLSTSSLSKRRGSRTADAEERLKEKKTIEGNEEAVENDKGDEAGEKEDVMVEERVKLDNAKEADDEEEEAEAEAEAEDEDEDEAEGDEDDDDGGGGQEVTRCVCHTEDDDIMMIQCDKCNVWQHGGCMGIWGDDEAPDEYFCEECRPDLHGPLRKWIRSRGRNVANFVAPSPEDLLHFHSSHDKHPPSQSKRWLEQDTLKPTSRSHHRKEPASPAETQDGRRSTRGGRPLPAHTLSRSEKSTSTGTTSVAHHPPLAAGTSRRRGHDRRVSIDVSPSRSPPVVLGPGGVKIEPKRRSTMNSRDAAYEEAVKAAMEASRREMGDDQDSLVVQTLVASATGEAASAAVAADREVEDRKRRRADDDDGEGKKGKKRKDEEVPNEEPVPAPPPKPKHPNQYTYRPKLQPGVTSQPATASPARRPAAGTPQPNGAPPAHDHGTRRAGAIASNLAAAPYTPASVSNLNWYLPDHLSMYADLLPAATPLPLQVPTPRTLAFLPRNHFVNHRYGPFVDERDEDGNLVLSDDRPEREVEGEPSTHREPPTRVRYPVKRITVSEIKKRVRNLLEYVGRVQLEESKRAERSKAIGLREGPFITKPVKQDEVTEKSGKGSGEDKIDVDGDTIMAEPNKGEEGVGTVESTTELTEEEPVRATTSLVTAADTPTSSQLLDGLMRDLIAFQETLHSGSAVGMNGTGSPAPTIGGVLETPLVPPTPTMPVGSSVPEVEVDAGVVKENVLEATGEEAEKEENAVDTVTDTTEGTPLPALPTVDISTFKPEPQPETEIATTDKLLEHVTEAKTEIYREGIVDAVVVQEVEPEHEEKEVVEKVVVGACANGQSEVKADQEAVQEKIIGEGEVGAGVQGEIGAVSGGQVKASVEKPVASAELVEKGILEALIEPVKRVAPTDEGEKTVVAEVDATEKDAVD